MLHSLWKQTTAAPTWGCALFEVKQPQHQVDVAPSLNSKQLQLQFGVALSSK